MSVPVTQPLLVSADGFTSDFLSLGGSDYLVLDNGLTTDNVFTVIAENRTFTVDAESRMFTVVAESRTFTVEAD